MRLLLSVASLCLTALGAVSHGAPFPTCRVPRVLEPPVLDGQLDDAVWKSAPVITDLVTSRDHKPARFRTEFRFVYDAEALYAAVTAHEPNLDKLRIGQDPLTPWWDDCIEIFLDPQATRTRYFQHIINAAATVASSYVGDFAADVPAEAVAGRTQDAWTL